MKAQTTHSHNFKDLTGNMFGRLRVLRYVGKDKGKYCVWECSCSCGTSIIVRGANLSSGNTSSCGCLHVATATHTGRSNAVHGHAKHGSESPTYRSWVAMRYRCTNLHCTDWDCYGGRGVRICTRWLNSFEAFLKDIGPRPKGKTLDRIDHNGHYVLGNVRWATPKQQAHNRRHHEGEEVIPFVDVK